MNNKLYEYIVDDKEVQALFEVNWQGAVATGLTAAALAFGSPSGVEAKPTTAIHQTLGQQNNNPINLKAFDNWRGMTGKDKFGHAIFATLEDGIRASLKNLVNHQKKNPNETLRQYMRIFKTKKGDYQAEYIASKLGISPDTQRKDLDMAKVLIPLAKIESGIVLH